MTKSERQAHNLLTLLRAENNSKSSIEQALNFTQPQVLKDLAKELGVQYTTKEETIRRISNEI